jgi:hypothetical protein
MTLDVKLPRQTRASPPHHGKSCADLADLRLRRALEHNVTGMCYVIYARDGTDVTLKIKLIVDKIR